MSRIGKLKIPCPETVKVSQTGDRVVVKGPNGELSEKIHPFLSIRIESDGVHVEKGPEQRKADALSGLTRTLIANMVKGVTELLPAGRLRTSVWRIEYILVPH